MARGLHEEDDVPASASASNRSSAEASSSRALSILRAALQATRSNRSVILLIIRENLEVTSEFSGKYLGFDSRHTIH